MEEPKADRIAERIVPHIIEDEMKSAYLDYSMSVLVGRALPDVRDGLKPVQRRILYTMFQSGLTHEKPFRKSANVVGNCMARYHPHGDAAIYDALVRMAQDFSLRYLLVQGQGNFGSIDGDNPAAMRYTEARMTRLAEEMLEDIDKETVDFVPNFDGSTKEPAVLPSKLPNLLINGCSGIAVGMATSIPPHNLREIADAVLTLIKNREASTEELMRSIKGPDFPTGGIICGSSEIKNAYETGHGSVKVKAKVEIEEHNGKQRIIVTEIPFMVNKALLIEQIADLVKDKKVPGISDLRDESDRDGMRIVIELKKDANSDVVLNQLFAHSRLESSFGIMLIGLDHNEPKSMGLKQLLILFIDHRREVVRRRTAHELRVATERAHILDGIIIALENIDDVVELIKASRDAEVAKAGLMKTYALTDVQAQAILETRLARLASLEQQKIRDEKKELLIKIEEYSRILASESLILDIISRETEEVKSKYGDDRRTEITDAQGDELETEDLIQPADMAVTITRGGYIKRLPVETYRQQKRGGKGVIGTETKEEDVAEKIFVANTHSFILFFTSKGMVYWQKVYKLPEAGRTAMGKHINNLLSLDSDERITAFIPVKEFSEGSSLVMATRMGIIKKASLMEYSRPRNSGIIAVNLQPGDELVNVGLTKGGEEIIIASKNGQAVRFHESDVRSVGRNSTGVRGIRLVGNDSVVGMVVAEGSATLLTVSEKGYGKRTDLGEYRLTKRGGKGVTNLKVTDKNGQVLTIKKVSDLDELMLISKAGLVIRMPASGISVIGRATQGVRLMRLNDDDSLVDIAIIPREEV
jgi:DNA gyrase subunit A